MSGDGWGDMIISTLLKGYFAVEKWGMEDVGGGD